MSFLRVALPTSLAVTLALWLGSLAHLLISVISLFKTFPKADSDFAPTAANHLFNVSERYHIALGICAVIFCVGWRWFACSRKRKILTWLIVAALVVAACTTVFVSTPMNRLRAEGLGGSPQFMKLHGVANVLYLLQSALVLASVAFTSLTILAEADSRGKA